MLIFRAIFAILGYISLGFLGARFGLFGPRTLQFLYSVAMYLVMPLITWQNVHTLQFHPDLIFAATAPWIQLGLGIAFSLALAKIRGYPSKLTRSLMLVTGFSNTSFLGFPMLIAVKAPHLLPIATVVDQFGSFFALTWFGPWIVSVSEGSRWQQIKKAAISTFAFPPLWAMLLAAGTRIWVSPTWGLIPEELYRWIRAGLTPLTVVTVGIALYVHRAPLSRHLTAVRDTLAFRLLVMPALMLGLTLVSGTYKTEIGTTATLEVAMAPMITSILFGIDAKLEIPYLVQSLVLGILASFITLPLWAFLLRSLGAL